MYNSYSSPTIRNTIFWGNTAITDGAQIYNDDTNNSPVISDSVVQGGYAGTNIITTDPMLGALDNYGGLTQTIPLLAHSSAINKGNNATCAASDQRGIPRPQGAHCDIGAFELVDNTPPDTSIDSQNPATTPTNSTSMTFIFSGTDADSGVKSFECDLDGGGFTACSSPESYASLPDGSHTFQVHAIDFVGNVDASPASRTWTVDTIAPTVNIFTIITPSNSLNIPITAFSATDDVALTGYLITMSSAPPAAGAAGWTSTAPLTFTVTSDGSYNLYPWAKDAASNVSAVFATPRAVEVDSTAPDTQIDTHPTNQSNSSDASFTFSSADGTATFECSLEGYPYAACTSPTDYMGLAAGSHTFAVRAKDPAGNWDTSPASYTWVIDLTAPTVVSSVRLNPSPTDAANVDFTVTFSEAVLGVDVSDFFLTTTGVSGAYVTSISDSGMGYIIAVNTGSGSGTIRLDVPISATITDLAGNPLTSLPYTGGETYVKWIKVFTIFLPLILH
jgi:hypothetical protein